MNGHNSIEVAPPVPLSPTIQTQNGGYNGLHKTGNSGLDGLNRTGNGLGLNGGLVDYTWELRVLVTDLQVERTLRVKSDLHIGGVMIKLVDELGRINVFFFSHSHMFMKIALSVY